MNGKSLEITAGINIPLVGFGTWELRGEACQKSIETAYSLGYRHFDTALLYNNHTILKKVLSGCNDVFISSKFMHYHLDEMSVTECCMRTLEELGREKLDLFMMHYPDESRPMEMIIEELGSLVEKGLTRAVGVSNFTIAHLKRVLPVGAPLCVNQVEYHPYLNQKELLAFCNAHGLHLISFRSLGKGALIDDPILNEIGAKYGKSGAQISLRWLIQKGIPVIPKSTSKEHIKENFEVLDFHLSEEDFLRLDSLPQKPRFCQNQWSDF
ncbi:MAG: putative oxidoreductase [Chlamydiales bacterium]|nr:putative oxidoreductase [Chlamydiales bacterium]MCH9619092.1 putative oxidoreductase [Chlamydiales bacterium]MCH9622354.1 putative oxidoreductase [Chlamydiales bacterium]